VPPSGGEIVPPSGVCVGGCGRMLPHTPWVLPMGWMHIEPAQQSPVIEHEPPTGTQLGPPPGEA